MAVHPDVQKKAQAEMDRVIGSRRLPTLDDRKSLPYVEAIYRELMRTAPPLPTGVPHSVTENDLYKGYFIPKACSTHRLLFAFGSLLIGVNLSGATILPNIWSRLHSLLSTLNEC